MNDDKRIIDIICDYLLLLAWLFVVIICIILCFSMPVHASSDQYYFPMQQNENGHFTDIVISSIENYLDSDNYYIFAEYWAIESNWFVTYYVRWPKSDGVHVFSEIYSNAYQFSLYRFPTDYSSLDVGYLRVNMVDGSVGAYNASFDHFYGLGSSSYYSGCDYVSNFQLYTNNTDSRKIVLLYDNGLGDDDTIPEGTEKPDIENYIPSDTTPPIFDNSSVEAALGSIFDYLQYETNKISGTITGIGKYLSDSLMWGLQMVINNIRSKIQEMITAIGDKIDDVKVGIGSIIDNIEDFVDYIKEPVDKQAIETALEGTTLYSVSNIGSSIKNIFSDYFDSIPQPDTLVFTIPYTILTKSGYITIDFSWYAGIRSSVIPWIVGFLYAGFGLAIFRSIPSIIHGVSGVLQKGG